MRSVQWAAIAAAWIVLGGPATAQGMTPMLGEVRSFGDHFAIRVNPSNPYRHLITAEVKVYDQNFRPVQALVTPAVMEIAGGQTRSVTVTVPFEGEVQRKVRICTESIPIRGPGQPIRTQICGKFLAIRF